MNDLSEGLTEDAFLGGRLRLRQPASGHRAGHDAMLLAAATAAHPGDRIADFGAGVGAAGLAVARRVAGLSLALVEIDPRLAGLAAANAKANGLLAEVKVLDILAGAGAFAEAGLAPDSFDGVLMNPPFHDAGRHRASPDAERRAAHVAGPETLDGWIGAARRLLRSGGVLTMIWRADGLADVLAALRRGFGSLCLQPVHGDGPKPAIRILVRAVKGGRAPLRMFPGIVLNGTSHLPHEEADAVLRGEAVLPFAAL